MIARARRGFSDAMSEYREAIVEFTPNARRLLLMRGLQDAGMGILITVFAIYVKAAGLSETVVGGFEGTVGLAAAAVCLLAPVLVAVLGYRRLFLLAALAFTISRFGAAMFPFAGMVLAFGFFGGAGEGVANSMPSAFYADNSEAKERTHLFSIDMVVSVAFGFLGSIAGGIIPLLLRGVLGEFEAYRATVIVAAALFAFSAIPVWGIEERVGKPGRAFARYRATLRNFRSWGHLLRILVPQLLISLGAGLVMPFVSLYLKHELGASIDQVGFVQGITHLLMGVAALGGPLIARRFGLIRGLVVVQAISLPFLFAIPLTSSLALVSVLIWIRTALMNMTSPLLSQFTVDGVPSREKPFVAGGLAFAWSVGWFVGSVIGGSIMAYSYTLPYFITTAFYAAGVLAMWLLLGRHEAQPPQVPAA